MKVILGMRCHNVVRQVFSEVEYVGKCIAETKASYLWCSLDNQMSMGSGFHGIPEGKGFFHRLRLIGIWKKGNL